MGIQKERAAHTILVDCMSQYDQAAQGKGSWTDVATMCQAGYEKFSGTKVAPYILAVQVDALLAEQKQSRGTGKTHAYAFTNWCRFATLSIVFIKIIIS